MTGGNREVVFPGPGCAQLRECAIPSPGRGQVLIRTALTMISTGTELTVFCGEFEAGSEWAKNFRYPFVPGYSNIGEVVRVGEGVEPELVGCRVASWGTHSAWTVQDREQVYPIGRQIPDDVAVFFVFPQIVLNAVRRGGVRLGQAVAVFGLGLLGQFTVRFCRMAGALPVFAVDVADERLARLPVDAMVIPVQPCRDDWVGLVREKTRGRMVDTVFEVTGKADLIPQEFAVLHEQGNFVVVSSPTGRTAFDFHDLCNRPSHTIIGAHNYSHPKVATQDNPWTMARDVEFFFDCAADGLIDTAPLVSHRVGWREAPSQYEELRKDRSRAMGVLVDWRT